MTAPPRYLLASSLFLLSACGGGSCELSHGREKCGREGQTACATHGPDEGPCDPGLTWEQGTNKCVSDCGDVGERCCKSYGYGYDCGGANHCNAGTNRCEGGAPKCASGSNRYVFSCVTEHGCALELTHSLATADAASAKACLKDAFGCASISEAPIKSYKFCYEFHDTKYPDGEIDAVDDAGAKECAEFSAGINAENVTVGACKS